MTEIKPMMVDGTAFCHRQCPEFADPESRHLDCRTCEEGAGCLPWYKQEIEQLKSDPYFECWMLIHGGKPGHIAESGVGKVFGEHHDAITDAYEDIATSMESYLCEEQIPDGEGVAHFQVSNLHTEEDGNYETGATYTYWEMDMKLIRYEFPSEEKTP